MSSHHYHRATDPVTSRKAAEQLDLRIRNKHLEILRCLIDLDNGTDDDIATEAVFRGIVKRHEEARRLIRTLRDRTAFIVPQIDEETGLQALRLNESGRHAHSWTLSAAGTRFTLETPLTS